jgi:hypothetical protein
VVFFANVCTARAITAVVNATGDVRMSDEENTEQSDQLDQSEQQDAVEPEQRATDGTGMIWVIAFAVLILAMVLAF